MQVARGRLSSVSRLESFQAQLNRMKEVVDRKIEFGHPHHPIDLSLNYPPGAPRLSDPANQHNGTLDNIQGSWVEITLASTAAADRVCTHNLYVNDPTYTVPVTGEPNCRWLHCGTFHDGVGGSADATAAVAFNFVGGTVAKQSINLRFWVTLTGTVNIAVGVLHPIRVCLFFIKAVRGE